MKLPRDDGHAGYSDADDPWAEIISRALFGAGLAAATIYAASQTPFPTTFDFNSPDFDPIFLLPTFFGVVCLWQFAMAGRAALRLRRFGTTRLELFGRGPFRPGGRFAGRIRTRAPIRPEGPWRITLQCVETHAFADRRAGAGSGRRDHAFVVWEESVERVPDAVDSSAGIPFSFTLPTTLAPPPDPSPVKRDSPYFSFKAAVFIPGMRRVWSRGSPPTARFWRIVATAPMKGTDFRAEFAAPVEG